MFRQLAKRVRDRIGLISQRNGRPRPVDPTLALAKNYDELLRLAQQIESHAEKAPYPHVAEKLRRIAREKRELAGSMKEKLAAWERNAGEPASAVKSGKNHWERMVLDLDDQKALEEGLIQLGDAVAEHDPQLSRMLRDIAVAQNPHKEDFLDLIARADPQAHQY